jgi:manganese/iron transport system ATP-binding protein
VSAVVIRDVSAAYGDRTVLENVNLALDSGDFMGLIGPNGAGKTTLLRAVLGLVPRTGGTITVEGRRRDIGYVPQRHEFAWDFPISVEETVMTGRVRRIGWLRRPGTEDYEAVLRALARVDMLGLQGRPIGQLSGGQRQRVLVARALVLKPDILLLDEPFTGLDVPSQELLTRLFGELAAEGKAVMMTTHDLIGAMLTCTKIAMINRTVIASGAPDSLRDPALWERGFRITADSHIAHALGLQYQGRAGSPKPRMEVKAHALPR